jgi:hypothetical protein
MVAPHVRPWIEQRDKFACQRIVRRRVTSLEIIAPRAGSAEIVESCRAAMLLRTNVIGFVRKRRALLRQSAILASVAGALAHLLA